MNNYFIIFIFISIFFTILNSRKIHNGRIIEFKSFDDFKIHSGRRYFHQYEEDRSRKAYEENIRAIQYHNELYKNGSVSFRMRANCMADLAPNRYHQTYIRLLPSMRYKDKDPEINREMVGAGALSDPGWKLPDELDWRTKGFITPPDDQGSCGACYAFSVARSLSGQIFKRTGRLVDLSAQQLVDCSAETGNKGCIGGSLRNTLKYLQKTDGGLMRQQDYTYSAKQGKCQYNKDLSIVNVTTWNILPSKDEEAVKLAVAAVGPVPVSLNAVPQSFQLYSDGVYDDSKCTSDTVNHAMLVVGYTKDYWILKNWWGSNWGEDGYMKLKRGKNLCGIANYAAYALV